MKKVNENNKLAVQMLVAMVSGILVGLGFMAIREPVGADSALWSTINSVLFQNISAAGDALTSIAVAKSEGKLDLDIYNK